ncbi:MAG: 50S ribosomal protein L6 [Proteobacteria bacterium]|nr:50S ribosomal protein L6 [Pseudomonadota bacterium]MCH8177815.1 50S ribosomal protein L6 [Pseudomonadota bacterium]
MSRIAKQPVEIPSGVEVSIDGRELSAKGPKGNLSVTLHASVNVTQDGNILSFSPRDDEKSSMALAGTMRAVVNNIVAGVSTGYEKKLVLVGVGYRVQLQGKNLKLSLGLSHPVNYAVPEGIEVETPSATEITVRGCSKQQVGQVCAEIRAFRPPEPYKGKGVKYLDEQIVRKDAKKK